MLECATKGPEAREGVDGGAEFINAVGPGKDEVMAEGSSGVQCCEHSAGKGAAGTPCAVIVDGPIIVRRAE